jgi:hypothetical protein
MHALQQKMGNMRIQGTPNSESFRQRSMYGAANFSLRFPPVSLRRMADAVVTSHYLFLSQIKVLFLV